MTPKRRPGVRRSPRSSRTPSARWASQRLEHARETAFRAGPRRSCWAGRWASRSGIRPLTPAGLVCRRRCLVPRRRAWSRAAGLVPAVAELVPGGGGLVPRGGCGVGGELRWPREERCRGGGWAPGCCGGYFTRVAHGSHCRPRFPLSGIGAASRCPTGASRASAASQRRETAPRFITGMKRGAGRTGAGRRRGRECRAAPEDTG